MLLSDANVSPGWTIHYFAPSFMFIFFRSRW